MSQQQHRPERDRVIADTGWGIKPDDQPANAAEAAGRASQTYRYDPNEPDLVRRILLAQRRGFNTANRVRVERGRMAIIDINRDEFVVEGLGYGDANLVKLLGALGAAFDPEQLVQISPDDPVPREVALSRAWAWGAERAG